MFAQNDNSNQKRLDLPCREYIFVSKMVVIRSSLHYCVPANTFIFMREIKVIQIITFAWWNIKKFWAHTHKNKNIMPHKLCTPSNIKPSTMSLRPPVSHQIFTLFMILILSNCFMSVKIMPFSCLIMILWPI